MIKTILPLALFLCVASLNASAQLEAQVVGLWAMETVMEASDDVTSDHDPHDERWIRFDKDGSFESDGRPYGPNSGKWKVDEDARILYLDSDTENDDSEWTIGFQDEKMIWRGMGDPKKMTFQLFYTPVDAP